MVGGHHTRFDQYVETRGRIEPQERPPIKALARLQHLTIGAEPRFRDRPQAGIGRFHPPEPDLLEQLGDGICLG